MQTRDQKALQTTITRGETLLTSGGYTIEPYADRPGVYSVMRGENDPRPLQSGETLWNDVDIVHQDCTCRAFEFHGNCKHLIAVNMAVAEATRILSPMLPTASVPAAAPAAPSTAKYGSDEWKRRVTADFG